MSISIQHTLAIAKRLQSGPHGPQAALDFLHSREQVHHDDSSYYSAVGYLHNTLGEDDNARMAFRKARDVDKRARGGSIAGDRALGRRASRRSVAEPGVAANGGERGIARQNGKSARSGRKAQQQRTDQRSALNSDEKVEERQTEGSNVRRSWRKRELFGLLDSLKKKAERLVRGSSSRRNSREGREQVQFEQDETQQQAEEECPRKLTPSLSSASRSGPSTGNLMGRMRSLRRVGSNLVASITEDGSAERQRPRNSRCSSNNENWNNDQDDESDDDRNWPDKSKQQTQSRVGSGLTNGATNSIGSGMSPTSVSPRSAGSGNSNSGHLNANSIYCSTRALEDTQYSVNAREVAYQGPEVQERGREGAGRCLGRRSKTTIRPSFTHVDCDANGHGHLRASSCLSSSDPRCPSSSFLNDADSSDDVAASMREDKVRFQRPTRHLSPAGGRSESANEDHRTTTGRFHDQNRSPRNRLICDLSQSSVILSDSESSSSDTSHACLRDLSAGDSDFDDSDDSDYSEESDDTCDCGLGGVEFACLHDLDGSLEATSDSEESEDEASSLGRPPAVIHLSWSEFEALRHSYDASNPLPPHASSSDAVHASNPLPPHASSSDAVHDTADRSSYSSLPPLLSDESSDSDVYSEIDLSAASRAMNMTGILRQEQRVEGWPARRAASDLGPGRGASSRTTHTDRNGSHGAAEANSDNDTNDFRLIQQMFEDDEVSEVFRIIRDSIYSDDDDDYNSDDCEQGLESEFVNNIAPKILLGQDNSKAADKCVICHESLGGREVRSLPCSEKHCYHVPCIDRWLRSHVTCPNCRVDLRVGQESEACNQGRRPGLQVLIDDAEYYEGLLEDRLRCSM